MACCRKAPTDRFMTRAIFDTGDFAFECARNSRSSSLDHGRLVIFLVAFRFFFAIYLLAVSGRSYTRGPKASIVLLAISLEALEPLD